MRIEEITANKRRFLPLLLVGDEQESMIDRYLTAGRLFALYDGEGGGEISACGEPGLRAAAVLTDRGGGAYELNNLSVDPAFHRQGYGRAMLDHLAALARAEGGARLIAATGESPLTLPFYAACGFTAFGREPGYFPRHYSHPIVEGGVLLCDLIWLERKL